MYILGHAGFTLAAGLLVNRIISRKKNIEGDADNVLIAVNNLDINKESQIDRKKSFNNILLDLRILVIGSMLPDIIDKPLGVFIFSDSLSNGRAYSHTLVFIILLSLAGWLLWRYGKKLWLLTLSIGSFMHLLLDQMWREPFTMFWPVFGTGLEKANVSDWVQKAYNALFIDPYIYIPEILGASILVWFIARLIYKKELLIFLKNGKYS